MDPSRRHGSTLGLWFPATVQWPSERQRRSALADAGIPRLLLVSEGTPVPDDIAEDEDWVRLPAHDDDVASRLRNLAARFGDTVRLADGVLRTPRGRVTLSPREASVLAVLLEHRGRLAPRQALLDRIGAAGDHRRLHDAVHRLRRKVRRHGLDIFSTRGRGYLLELRVDQTDNDAAP